MAHILRMEILNRYLSENSISQSQFAAMVGTTQATVSRIASGKMRPGLDLAIAISRATDGAVSPDMWVSQEETDAA